ncbi:UNVERIFIED_ORG: hypothetical protein M2438_001211 [Methylobacterium sp. SuP10 SLI 274]|uniref:hypothetical protein n=1 Tax=Methylorubrum extorquens TaxID=408 RepID=UPI00209E1636|nr:hypothetical protein [Methylorubrum extorquens]MDF9862422.1 hypothetical protein [Methylorubrum pseudosasae]MDH6636036.1 hypothetical protein [Methylobacterium sp. SuP10 SLI 274]MDH6665210.1 hypothetical protein [Methylorubrum zatmanii]MCP1557137.1 hypothetical protein [Methylorubrum extorquens]MDF9790715.1 hypothetical protein [Methylorubrum extorquens]
MKLIKYIDMCGKFDHDLYKSDQENGKKIDKIWASEDVVRKLGAFLKSNIKSLHFGLCHRTRRGKKWEWFSKYTDANSIGLEISETAIQFPRTLQWDFHETKFEWIGKVDAIYSNLWGRSYDPGKYCKGWLSCILAGSILFLEHTTYRRADRVSQLDPFDIALDQFVSFLAEIGQGLYRLVAALRNLTNEEQMSKIGLAVVAVRRHDPPIDLEIWRSV